MYYSELKNRKVRSGSVVQSTKVLREPIQDLIAPTRLYTLPSAVAVPLKNSLLRA